MTARNAPTSMTKRQFADLFGVSEKQLERFFSQGMPHDRQSARKILIPMPAGREWYKEYLVKKGEKAAQPSSIDEARRRKETASAELEELKLAREKGQTMRVTDHVDLLADGFARVRAKLLNFAQRAAGAAFGTATIQECQAKLEPLVTEMMEELAAARDVPSGVDEAA